MRVMCLLFTIDKLERYVFMDDSFCYLLRVGVRICWVNLRPLIILLYLLLLLLPSVQSTAGEVVPCRVVRCGVVRCLWCDVLCCVVSCRVALYCVVLCCV